MTTLRSWAGDTLAATLLLWLPLVIFLRHNAYPVFSAEVALLAGIFLLAGAVWGLAMTLGRTPVRIAVVTFLAVLVVDIQTDWITTWGLRLLLNTIFFGVVAWLLRRRLTRAVILLGGLMVLGALLTPPGRLVHRAGLRPGEGHPAPDLPCVIHIVLDEHIGIEGIPAGFDPDRAIAGRIRDDYAERGFTVFGRAYSRYYNTEESLGNALNFTASDVWQRYYPPHFRRGALLEENAWFELLQDRGYEVHVFQTDFMTFHRTDPDGGPRLADGSLTIRAETIGALGPLAIPAREKARFILGSYQRLSFFLGLFHRAYASARHGGVPLPDWDESGDRLSTLSSLQGLDLLRTELADAGPGRAFFVHLLLPHYPYAYRADCTPRPMAGTWLDADDTAAAPRRNDDASRAVRYPLYLEQLECTHARLMDLLDELSARDWWRDAVVVVHGDHGSRIDRGPPEIPTVAEMVPQDFLDAFSTLFAVKTPVLSGGYDRRQLPLDHLLGRILRDGADPGDADLEARPRVWIRDGQAPLRAWSLPGFRHGLPDGTVPGPLEPSS